MEFMVIQSQILRESVSQSNMSVDESAGVIRGVKILSGESKHGYTYTQEAMRAAVPKYAGLAARVNIDHPVKGQERRSWFNRIGKITNVRLEGDGIYGDLEYNPAHPYGPALAWAAKNQPDTLGLSHTALGRKTVKEGKTIIDHIEKIHSVDLVADPATNSSLFESENMEPETPVVDATADDFETHIANAINALVTDKEMDMAEKKKKIAKALKLIDDAAKETGDESEAEEEESEEETPAEKKPDEESLKIELTKLKGEKKARQLCESMKVPATETFIESLALLGDEKKMKALIEDRKAVVNKPRSNSPSHKHIKLDEFAEALKR